MSTAKNKAAAQPSSRRKDALSPLAECEAESHEKRSVKNGKKGRVAQLFFREDALNDPQLQRIFRRELQALGGLIGLARVLPQDAGTALRRNDGVDRMLQHEHFPVFPSCEACDVAGDVIIDFSTAKAVPALLAFSKAKKIPVVLCTTALSEETTALMQETSKEVAILKSANMSVGVNLLLDLVQRAAVILAESGFDIEIVEKHHNQKIDAPSGTAMALADAINQAMEERYHYVYDRSQVREKREKTEIGIHAVRGGNIVGEHDVIFAGRDEVIELTHRATSREVFAVGAVKAAKFLAGKPAGLYTMKEVLQ